MAIATISSKGQITLPSEIRKELGIKPNDRVTIQSSGSAVIIRRVPNLLELKGSFGKAVSQDAEEDAIEIAAAEHAMGLDG